MSERAFLDTNVLVYAYDRHDSRKQQTAQSLLTSALLMESGVVSSQILGEFFVVATQKIKDPLAPEEAEDIIHSLSALPVVFIDAGLVLRALDTVKTYRIAYWDALVIAAAERAGCVKVLSEDLNAGQEYHGMQVVNPFR